MINISPESEDKPLAAWKICRCVWIYVCCAIFSVSLGSVCRAQSDRDKALAQFQEAGRLRDAGDFTAAMGKYEQLLQIVPDLFGESSAPMVGVSSELASIYVTLGKFKSAEELYQRSLSIQKANLGEDHPQVAKVLNGLANLHHQQGRIVEAEKAYRSSISICEKKAAPNDPILSVALNGLALVCTQNGSYAEAETRYSQCIDICLNQFGLESEQAGVLAGNIAQMFFEQGKYADAEKWFSRSLGIQLKVHGENHVSVANTAVSIGAFHYRLGRYDAAEFFLQKSLKILEAKFPQGSLGTINALNALGQLESALGHEDQAKVLFQKANAMGQSLGLADHPFVAATLTNQGIQKIKLGEIREAEADMLKAHEIYQKSGAGPAVTLSLHNLSVAYQRAGKFADAEVNQKKSLAAWKANFGDAHPFVIVGSSNLGRLYHSMQRWPEALQAYDDSRRGAYRHSMEVVPGLPEQDQLNFLVVQDRVHLHRALSLALARPDDNDTQKQSVEWIANSKGIAEWSRSKTMALARESQAPETADALAALKDSDHQISRLTLLNAESKTGSDASREMQLQIASLKKRRNQLVVELQKLGSAAVDMRPWVETSQIQAALSADSTLVDFLRLNQYAPDQESIQSERYVAWVISKNQVRLVDLGAAKEIEKSVSSLRKQFDAAASEIEDVGEKIAEESIRRELDTLSKQLLAPLLPHLTDCKRLIMSPDADLWLLPWNALLLPNQKYVIEDFVLEFVVNSGELASARTPVKDVQPSAPVILADPDFSEATQAGTEPRGRSVDLKLGNISRLPGTAEEGKMVRTAFAELYKKEPLVYMQGEANSTKLLAVNSPQAMAVATHGFYLPSQSTKSADNAATLETPTMLAIEDPLLRCGLLLAGCNLPGDQGIAGVVTGRDILGLDLRGCEMVILSACETGLGDVNNGDGVAGLRQAFHLAGTRCVVASLWNIPDAQTATQMKNMMKHLIAGRDLPLALCEAQREVLTTRRTQTNASHPYLWAAFNVTSASK